MPELCHSVAVGATCCERCHSAASSAPVGKPIAAPVISRRPARKASAYAQLVRSVIATFERTSEHVCGTRSAIGGLGDPALPICGYCPVCEQGIVAVQIVGSQSRPRLRLDDTPCSGGCDWRAVAEAFN